MRFLLCGFFSICGGKIGAREKNFSRHPRFMVRGYPVFFSLLSLPHLFQKKSQNKNSLTSILFGSGDSRKQYNTVACTRLAARVCATRSRCHVVYAVHLYLLDRRCPELCRSSHGLRRRRPRLTATPFGNEPKKILQTTPRCTSRCYPPHNLSSASSVASIS